MKKHLLFCFFFYIYSYSQITGCTDSSAKNFNSRATLNDGSCYYNKTKIKPLYSKKISDSLKETSGLVYFDNLLWTHNDDHDTTLYGLDTLGKINKKIHLKNIKNQDWEEITQDSTFIYIGDFGNNATGNRTNLNILKIDKNTLFNENPIVENITFRYADQTNFSPTKPNQTQFDSEAFVVTKDSIYLFTKQWKTSKTSIYTLPNKSGNHIARLKNTFNTKGLLTGATYIESKKILAMCGYSKTGKAFIYLLYDFKDHDFISGNKRKINLGLSFHQIEGITTKDGIHYYITNEALIRKPILNIPQQIHYFDLSSVLNSYLHK